MKKLFLKQNRIIIIGLLLITGLTLISFGNPVKTTTLPENETLTPAPEGTVINLSFYSKSLKKDQNIQVYLPEGYDDFTDVGLKGK